jgi:signal transduction histidine kinase
MRLVVETTAATTDDDFFRALVENLVEATGVMAAFVTELVPEREGEMRTKALWIGGQLHDNMQYPFVDSPCEVVFNSKEICIYPNRVRARFPGEEHLEQLNAESYIGVPYFGTTNRILGHLALIDDKPMENVEDLVAIGKLFAVRAGVELERSYALQALQHRVEMEKLLARISAGFINLSLDKTDSAIDDALRLAGIFAEVDRSYVYLFSEDGSTFSNSHEWCREDIESQKSNMQKVPVDSFPWLVKELEEHEVVHVLHPLELPSEARALKECLELHDVRSTVNVPMVSSNRLIGFLGFDAVRREKAWSEDDIRMLKIVGETFTIALEKRWADEELKIAQVRLVQSEKMAALGRLTAGIAHEVNNPISAVKSSADVVERCVHHILDAIDGSQTVDEVKSSVDFQQSLKLLHENNHVITSAADRISKMVTSLNRYSRPDDAEFQKIDIHEGIDSVLSMVHHELEEKIEVIKRYGNIPEIYCYPSELNQVFMNVLTNAIQAIEKWGTISIETSENNGKVIVEISDTGRGIPRKKLDGIFDLNFTTKDSRVAVGMGLYSAYNIVRKHRGDMTVNSEFGKGTSVLITLPKDLKESSPS